ncbi:Ribosomal protein S24e [uncultured archaeon]|nr:Ribosomal protein S24e [uncultured archaeon]
MEKIIIIHQRENPILKRKEVEIKVELEITPKTSEAEEIISKKFSSSIENVRIKKIKGKFGSKNFVIIANIYHSKEDKDKIEPKSKKDKGEKK